jgi:hypothetical protein
MAIKTGARTRSSGAAAKELLLATVQKVTELGNVQLVERGRPEKEVYGYGCFR